MNYRFKEILLIDDDSITNYIHQRLVTKLNIAEKITIKQDGSEALEYLSQCCCSNICPDLFIVDINMRELNGFEFLTKFQMLQFETKPNPKIILVSASAYSKDSKKAHDMGYIYLQKPLKAEDLSNLIHI